MAEADAVDDDIERQLVQETQILLPQPLRDPQARAPIRLGNALEVQHPVGVAAHESQRDAQRAEQFERLCGERPRGDVAAQDDEIHLELRNHGLQRGEVAVDVAEHGDARHSSIPITGSIRPQSLGGLSRSHRAPIRS